MKKVAVIGAGFAGLSAACFLARDNFDVTIYEKNNSPGGRARKFAEKGFVFDMGPSWYWMPDVFEQFFNEFGKHPSDYYTLKRLDPSYRIYFAANDYLDIPAGTTALKGLFESLEPGSSRKLDDFLREGKRKYEVGMHRLVQKPSLSLSDVLDPSLMADLWSLHIFQSISGYIKKFFSHPRIISILEFPVLFLGAKPEKTPALYSLMNYADMALGTWYPDGGMFKVVDGMMDLAKSLGVKFKFNSAVTSIEMNGRKSTGVMTGKEFVACDYIVAGADYNFVEQQLLPAGVRKYSEKYWDSRVLAPSSLIFYLGLNRKIAGLQHHTLFFDEEFKKHAEQIYDRPQWPSAPQFYVSCPSKSDESVAPHGCENMMVLIPVAPNLSDTLETREKYFRDVLQRLKAMTGEDIEPYIIYRRSYAHNDFIADYNSFKGNAYGLANTLMQTANFKPSIVNNNVPNLFYTGQLTVPGPGVPPSLISGKLVAKELTVRHNREKKLKL
jgi:phytoene desaturase